jgi:hypothetical protein
MSKVLSFKEMSGYVVNMVGLLFAGLGEAGEERECRE